MLNQYRKVASHLQKRDFCKGLQAILNQPISDNNTTFTTSEYPVVSDMGFRSENKTYTHNVMTSVTDMAAKYLD
ncbi:hypothetical protein DPMN_193134 [Dreissena polymorpha]|uniref:Uncharacterized protein n=1 Tax=Dreissena polymorpha TaxID=45954 RepID=A0A9D3Y3N1_DREPO|nr:hypothetical protein DPMN_193134 [Dreissena polymorpha]